jgi:hypothetical protein
MQLEQSVLEKWRELWKEHIFSHRMLFLIEDEEEMYEFLINSNWLWDGKSERYVKVEYKKNHGSINMFSSKYVRIEFHGEKLKSLNKLIWNDEKVAKIIQNFNWQEAAFEIKNHINKETLSA